MIIPALARQAWQGLILGVSYRYAVASSLSKIKGPVSSIKFGASWRWTWYVGGEFNMH
jgi:hypothetical protein